MNFLYRQRIPFAYETANKILRLYISDYIYVHIYKHWFYAHPPDHDMTHVEKHYTCVYKTLSDSTSFQIIVPYNYVKDLAMYFKHHKTTKVYIVRNKWRLKIRQCNSKLMFHKLCQYRQQ
jgi:hypothetical protein